MGEGTRPDVSTESKSQDVFDTRPKLTDIPCLLLFLAYLGGMCWIMFFAVEKGDLRKLVAGIDYAGRMCGIDEDVANETFLYWCPDPTKKVTNGVPEALNMDQPICLQSCPDTTSDVVMCPRPVEIAETATHEVVIKVLKTRISELSTYVTTPVGSMYCLPNLTSADLAQAESLKSELFKGDPFSNPYVQFNEAMGGLVEAKALLIGITCLGLMLSWLYLWVLSQFAKELIYGTIAVIVLSCVGVATFAFLTVYDVLGLQETNPLYLNFASHEAALYSQLGAGVLLLLALVVLVVVFCLHDTLEEVVGCIEAACEALSEMPTLWVQPILAALLKGGILLVVVTGLLYLLSTGKVSQNKIDLGDSEIVGFGRTLEFSEDEWKMIVYYGFGVIWIMEVCNALQTFIVSYAAVKWFALPNPKDNKIVWFPVVRGFVVGIVFHLGSLACGAFLLAVTRVLVIVLWLLSKTADKQGNVVAACLARCCMACVECFRRCLEYINKNAYCDIAIESNDFFFAAKKSFEFMASHAADIAILHGACWFGQFAGILLVSAAGAGITYMSVTSIDRWSSAESEFFIADPVVVCIIAGAICCTISAVLVSLFDDVADAMLYCYAIAREQGVAHIHAPPTLKALAAKYEKPIEAEPLMIKQEPEEQHHRMLCF